LFFALLAATFSCGSKESYIGTYTASAIDSVKQSETVLELKDNGQGVWRVGDDEVNFSWYVRSSELRINTKGGGVITGHVEGEILKVSLPGTKMMTFKRVK